MLWILLPFHETNVASFRVPLHPRIVNGESPSDRGTLFAKGRENMDDNDQHQRGGDPKPHDADSEVKTSSLPKIFSAESQKKFKAANKFMSESALITLLVTIPSIIVLLLVVGKVISRWGGQFWGGMRYLFRRLLLVSMAFLMWRWFLYSLEVGTNIFAIVRHRSMNQ